MMDQVLGLSVVQHVDGFAITNDDPDLDYAISYRQPHASPQSALMTSWGERGG